MKGLVGEFEELKNKVNMLNDRYEIELKNESIEIENARRSIHEKYFKILSKTSNESRNINSKLVKFGKEISNNSIFSINDLTHVIIDIISIYECKNYVFKKISFTSQSSIVQSVFVIVESSIKLEKSYDVNKLPDFNSYSKEAPMVVFNNIDLNNNVKLYDEDMTCCYSCNKLPYVRDFIDVLITSRISGISSLTDISNNFLNEKFDEISTYKSAVDPKVYTYRL